MTHELADNPPGEAEPVTMEAQGNNSTDPASKKRKGDQSQDAQKKPRVQENRAIYVTNLPRDADELEIENEFKKYGIIDQGADGNKRIKMYRDDDGNFNGEALIVYFRKDSVALAIRMMDDYYLRPGEQSSQETISVKEADFSYKKHKDGDEIKSKMTRKDKKASERTRAELNRKLAEWSDNEEEVAETFAPKRNKWAKVCILKHAFTLSELEEDDTAILDIKEDMREEAEKHGTVTSVTLYDEEPEGIVAVKFREFDAAEAFLKASHGRRFAGRTIDCTLAEDKPKFRKSAKDQAEREEDSDDE